MLLFRFLLGFVLASFPPFVFASLDQRVYLQYTIEDGLPSNTVYDVIVDHNGLLWMATDVGVCTFDGTYFKYLGLDEGLPYLDVISLCEDYQGRIWFRTFNQTVAFYQNGKIYNPDNHSLLSGIKTATVHESFYPDKFGVWIQGADAYYYYTGDTISTFLRQSDLHLHHDDYFYSSFFKADKGRPVLHNKQGIYVLENAESQYQHCWPGGPGTITFAKDNQIVIQRKDAIASYIPGKGERILYQAPNPDFFQGFEMIPKDKGDALWFRGKHRGLGRLVCKDDSCQFWSALYDFKVGSIFQDTPGNIWVSTLESGILFFPKFGISKKFVSDSLTIMGYLYDEDSKTTYIGFEKGFIQANKGDSKHRYRAKCIFNNTVNNVTQLVKGEKIWVGTNCFLGNILPGRLKPVKASGVSAVKALTEKDDTLYIASSWALSTYPIDHSDHVKRKHEERIVDLCFDTDSNLIVATMHAIYQYPDFKTPVYTYPKGITPVDIEVMNELLLVATVNSGVFIVNEGTSLQVRQHNAFFSNACYSLVVENDSTFWYGAKKGLTRVIYNRQKHSYKLFNLNKNLGLYENEVKELFIQEDSLIIVGTQSILSMPLMLNDLTTDIPLFWDSVTTETKTNVTGKITLNYGHKPLILSFGAIHQNSGGALQYFYKLHKNSSNWEPLSAPKLVLHALSPGDYDINIMAKDVNGSISQSPLILHVVVNPPYWKSTWFILLMISLILLTFIGGSYLSVRSVKKRERARTLRSSQMAMLELKALQAQMNPHFIYNTLSSIQSYILTNEKHIASSYLGKFSRLMRLMLESSMEPRLSLKDEIVLLQNYLLLEQLRLNHALQYEIKVSENVDTANTYIPPMFIQPLVENAIKHGVEKTNASKGYISVELTRQNEVIKVCVLNSKELTPESRAEEKNHSSHALNIMNSRIKNYNILHKQNIEFVIINKEKKNWYKVTLYLPVI